MPFSASSTLWELDLRVQPILLPQDWSLNGEPLVRVVLQLQMNALQWALHPEPTPAVGEVQRQRPEGQARDHQEKMATMP